MLDDQLKQLFATVLNIDASQITDDSAPGTLPGWESLNHLNLVASAEEHFDIDIEPEEIPEMAKSFATFKEIVSQKVSE